MLCQASGQNIMKPIFIDPVTPLSGYLSDRYKTHAIAAAMISMIAVIDSLDMRYNFVSGFFSQSISARSRHHPHQENSWPT